MQAGSAELTEAPALLVCKDPVEDAYPISVAMPYPAVIERTCATYNCEKRSFDGIAEPRRFVRMQGIAFRQRRYMLYVEEGARCYVGGVLFDTGAYRFPPRRASYNTAPAPSAAKKQTSQREHILSGLGRERKPR